MMTEAEVSVQDRQTDLTDSLGVDFTESQALEGSKNSEGPFAESSIPPIGFSLMASLGGNATRKKDFDEGLPHLKLVLLPDKAKKSSQIQCTLTFHPFQRSLQGIFISVHTVPKLRDQRAMDKCDQLVQIVNLLMWNSESPLSASFI